MHASKCSVLPLARSPTSNYVQEGGFPANCEGNLVLAVSSWLSSGQGSDTPSSIRIRENQRRSRNQRKELIQDLRRRVQEYEIKGVTATQEMQRAARKVAEENSLLRGLLASRGVTHNEVEAYLRSFNNNNNNNNNNNTTTTTPTTETPLDTGLLISCETAATIIAEMRGDGDRSRIRASLGCVGDEECNVKNTRVLELMDER
ncbi:hypothetical protein COCMIDRAFT_105873 [Bipolaris oryzae ATCC 44560]|uniref:BZIP domain-containing protein n=1 Tax=Bipolaris oryzae ATCC 44560 TaxID=930090 RepID=W6YVI2_COCMI|nr:uncharacterized protein COCMIDRAFT_105873 [Bipolaris oryzae ATCC 44560]EUC41560.1 hypothetical protein COCMIDRAFT_105873 [Bipolaris oryzae ATCC 44560]